MAREVMLLLTVAEADAAIVWIDAALRNSKEASRSSRAARRVLRKLENGLRLDALMMKCKPVDVRDLAKRPNSQFKARLEPRAERREP